MIDWKELARLRKVQSAPKLLSQSAVQWARRGGKLEDGVGGWLNWPRRTAQLGGQPPDLYPGQRRHTQDDVQGQPLGQGDAILVRLPVARAVRRAAVL